MEALLLKLKGKALSETGHLEEALVCLDRALELAPDLHTAWRERGHTYNLLKRWTEAAADFEHALELNATSSYDWHSRAYALYKCERYEEALAAIEQALELDPSPAIVDTMDQIYLGMGQ
ncbi:MAG: hypothetical protein C5B60_00895 [Chloroflexi bacterium]|nr:MAG: hypothetical protein C5B60_00895 [Chloroflexota bacterium]